MKTLSNSWRMVALSTCTALIISGMIACSSEDNIVNNEQTSTTQQGLKVTLTATFDDNTNTRGVNFDSDGSSSSSTFADGDKIYIYNETRGIQEREYLTVCNISADGKTASFSGTLARSYAPNEELKLFYNVSFHNKNHLDLSCIDYQDVLDGSATTASACDYAIADATVGSISSGTLTLAAPVTLQKMQSVFRQRLTFKNTSDGDALSTIPNITQMTISSQEGKLNKKYYLDGNAIESPIAIANPTVDSNKDIYLALRFSDGSTSSDAITFTAITSSGVVYVGTKTAPSGGFKNGKYYHGNLTLVKSNDKVLPNITWYNVQSEVTPNASSEYNVKPLNNYTEFALSGINKGYRFYLWDASNAIVRLNSFTCKWDGDYGFLNTDYTNLTIDITGTNTIDCRNYGRCISSQRSLKLSGSGTLTVTTNRYQYCGLYGDNYQDLANDVPKSNFYWDHPELPRDVTDLIAADGYTVMRSARSGSNPYTWTYTVTPKLEQPTITWNTVTEPVTLNTYDTYKEYVVYPTGGVIDFTLSGNSSAYRFNLYPCSSATIHLNGLNAVNVDQSTFIYHEGSGTLTLDLTGDNSISCRNWEDCISSEGSLKLSGNGTLTVTSTRASHVGIYANDNYYMANNSNATTTALDVSAALAAAGSTVTRSAITNNNNGTYTWTYTVTTP